MHTRTTVDDEHHAAALGGVAPPRSPVVIEARGIEKTFRVPEHRMDTFKERVTHPFTRVEYRELRALRDISFDVHSGEFFGIVGQNGSGKSTLLKILASIYAPDAGKVRMAGRLAPFIELGVGFNPELTARENTVINGVLMGLSKREARRRLDAVLEFAELEEFVELKLKNYSSGMMVRLAFAIMVQAEADIMLVDEVLAVGDAAFAQRCMDVFEQKRRAGATVVLVTHDMTTVQSVCDRAMVLDLGELQHVGDPEQAALQYYRLNFAQLRRPDMPLDAVPDFNAKVVHARLLDDAGEPVDNIAAGEPLVLDVLLQARRELVAPRFVLHVSHADGTLVFEVRTQLDAEHSAPVAEGAQVRLSGRIENPLAPGSYAIGCWVHRDLGTGDRAVQGLRLFDFLVYGNPRDGVVSVEGELRATPEGTP
jgi:ABC-type polysaccharide/polyol phosphate transport system ATPase subunit